MLPGGNAKGGVKTRGVRRPFWWFDFFLVLICFNGFKQVFIVFLAVGLSLRVDWACFKEMFLKALNDAEHELKKIITDSSISALAFFSGRFEGYPVMSRRVVVVEP